MCNVARGFALLFSIAASLGAQTALTPYPCSEASTLRSGSGSTPTQIQFRNDTPGAIKVYWIDGAARRTLYATVPAGVGFTQGTFSSHVWLVTDANEVC